MPTFQQRRGSASAWTSANTVLAAGEPGYETDTGKHKIGDGTTTWNSLPYQPEVPYRNAGGASREAKAAADTNEGVINWRHDSGTGYLFHGIATANSGAGTAVIGLGPGGGHASGLLVSARVTDGDAARLFSHPSHAGRGIALTSWNKTNFAAEFNLYNGSPGVAIIGKSGEGFTDGVANGTTTFTSATANFQVSDEGRPLVQSTTKNVGQVIPSGTTIVTRVSATQVTLSQPATGSDTAIDFYVDGRTKSPNDYLQRWFMGATLLGYVTQNEFNWKAAFNVQGTGANPASNYLTNNSVRGYSHNGTNYTRHSMDFSSTNGELRAYAGAGLGSEAAPATPFKWSQSGGAGTISFFGGALQAQKTGWAAPTGTSTRTTFDTSSVTLPVLAEHMKALIDDLKSYNLIGV